MKNHPIATALGIGLLISASAHAAFIVEADSSGLANGNFSFGGDTTSASTSPAVSTAIGLTGTSSLFGGDGLFSGDTYVFSYTLGTDTDNFSPSAGTLLGSTSGFGTETASGIAGGASGLYKVYWTLPATTNTNAAGVTFTITSDDAPLVLNPVDGNNGGTGADLDPSDTFVGGANNAWFLLGTVQLSAGSTYSVTQEANTNSFVSMRSHGVMWEAVPEPGSASLLVLAGMIGIARRRR